MRVACPDRNNVRYDRASCVTAPFAILLLLLLLNIYVYRVCAREFFVSLIKNNGRTWAIYYYPRRQAPKIYRRQITVTHRRRHPVIKSRIRSCVASVSRLGEEVICVVISLCVRRTTYSNNNNNNNICTSYIVFWYVIIILCKIIIIIIYVAPHEHCPVDIGPGEEQEEEIGNNKKPPTDERSADRVREREWTTTMRYLKRYNYNIYIWLLFIIYNTRLA